MFEIRAARLEDVPALAALHSLYMQELFGKPWSGSAEALQRDGFGRHIRFRVAEANGGSLIGFAGFGPAYDLHHCLAGGQILDMYVDRAWRGRGVALALVVDVASQVAAEGGKFVKGQAAGESQQRLYERLAMAFPGADCIVGGRAFRVLAGLAGRPVREIVRQLPERPLNFEP